MPTNLVSDTVADISSIDGGQGLVVEQLLPEEFLQLLVARVGRGHILGLRRQSPAPT